MNQLASAGMAPMKPSSGIAEDDSKIAFIIENIRGKRVLDLGCVMHNPDNAKSRFWAHKAIVKYASHCLGMDLYGEGVRKLALEGYNIIESDVEIFQLEEKFDVVVAGDIIEHLSNPGRMLQSARNHITQNGVMVITTPNPWYWRVLVKSLLRGTPNTNPEHTTWFCRETIAQLLSRHGWVVEKITYGSWPVIDNLLPIPRIFSMSSMYVLAKAV